MKSPFNKYSIGFTAEKRKYLIDDLRCVRLSVSLNGKRLRLHLNIQVNIDGWDAGVQRCRHRTLHGKSKTRASDINAYLDSIEDKIEETIRGFADAAEDKVDPAEVFAAIREMLGKKPAQETPTVQQIYLSYMMDCEKKNRWSDATIKKHRTIGRHLKSLGESLTLKELDALGVDALVERFSALKGKYGNGFSNETIQRDVRLIKTFLQWAEKKGYGACPSFFEEELRLKNVKKPVIFLTWRELMRLCEHDFSAKPYLDRTRDLFCFQCFTSLRYSDIAQLRKEHIAEGVIKLVQIKTGSSVSIDLNRFSQAILDKYSGYSFDGRALPVISPQKYNDYIKECAKECGIDTPVEIVQMKGTRRESVVLPKHELLSSHAGRRTFISIALMLGIPPNIVMKWTGHSNYEAMRPYIEITDEAKRDSMLRIERNIFKGATGSKL